MRTHQVFTKPSDMKFTGPGVTGRVGERLVYAIRECNSNAFNYNATKAFSAIIDLNHIDFFNGFYLLYFHDGRPPSTEEEILNTALPPNRSEFKGSSLQGAGLAVSAARLARIPILAFGSKTEREGLQCGVGFVNQAKPNRWNVASCPAFLEIVSTIMGKKLWMGYNVMYAFRCQAPKGSGLLKPETFTDVTFSAPSLTNDLRLTYCQQAISVDSRYEELRKRKGGGSANRSTINEEQYDQRFRELSETIRCNFEIPVETGLNWKLKTEVNIRCYPSPTKRKNVRSDKWMLHIRDGREFGEGYKWGTGDSFGQMPQYQKVTLSAPFVTKVAASQLDQDVRQSYQRFLDNKLVTYQQIARAMGALGLPFTDYRDEKRKKTVDDLEILGRVWEGSCNFRPFVVINVAITDLDVVDSNAMNKDPTESPLSFLDTMERTPDFKLANKNLGNKIIITACEHAHAKVSKHIKDWCEFWFRAETEEFAPLFFNTDGKERKKASGKEIQKTRAANVEAFKLDEKERIIEFDKQFPLGEETRLVIRHTADEKFLSAGELEVNGRVTRGVTLDIANVREPHKLKHLSEAYGVSAETISVVSLKVMEMSMLQGGKPVAIRPDQYEHRQQFLPSRNIALRYISESGLMERINLGVVSDIPMKQQRPPGPPEGIRSRKTNIASGIKTNTENAYCEREPEIICQLMGHPYYNFYFNQAHPMVQRLFKLVSANGAEITKHGAEHRMMNELAEECRQLAIDIYQSCERLEIQAHLGEEPDPYTRDDPADYIVNKTLIESLQRRSGLGGLANKLHQKLGYGSLIDEDED